MSRQPTSRQLEVVKTIQSLDQLYGYPPTVAEIARELSITPNAAYDHLRALRRLGRVSWMPRQARTLKVLDACP